jgi:hypothetical protein
MISSNCTGYPHLLLGNNLPLLPLDLWLEGHDDDAQHQNFSENLVKMVNRVAELLLSWQQQSKCPQAQPALILYRN